MMKNLYRLFILAFLGMTLQVHAVLDIKIGQGIEQELPIAIVPFGWSQAATHAPLDLAAIISDDLTRSGRFAVMEGIDLPQRTHEFESVNFNDWRLLGMENLLIGNLSRTDAGAYEVEFRLIDIYKGTQIAGFSIPTPKNKLRRTAHEISDIIFETLTGIRGAFTTRVAYITVRNTGAGKKAYALQIADADGYNPRVLLASPQPLLSPAWSPDGKKLAYVSFERKEPAVYVQDVSSGARQRVATTRGVNGDPAWSPDGKRLALTLTRDGNPEIYILNLTDNTLQRITHHSATDSEPAWSPDGKRLVFTSDRDGGPQIYQIRIGQETPERLTVHKGRHSSAIFSPDGNSIALIYGRHGDSRVALLDLRDGSLNVLTESHLDKSPNFAPNGSMIIYATDGPRGSILSAVSSDGRMHQRLALHDGEVREAAWGSMAGSIVKTRPENPHNLKGHRREARRFLFPGGNDLES